jgi:GNAT superfamily N-acetyltransferase
MTDPIHDLHLRPLVPDDIPFADSLRALAGWNQTTADWRRFLQLDPHGCFLAEIKGRPAGTVTTSTHGLDLAWIGMVLVHPDLRRRGVGRALLLHALEHLKRRGVRCIGLDATPEGRKVYEPLGFNPTFTLTRWESRSLTPLRQPSRHPQTPGFRDVRASDHPELSQLDQATFGVARPHLLDSLIRQSACARVMEGAHRQIEGWGLLREGARARYLGPVIATSDAAGVRMLEALLDTAAGHTVFCDIPDPRKAAIAWARRRGFTPQRSLTRMFLGTPILPASSNALFAITGPELG